jgi:hypothetical protein
MRSTRRENLRGESFGAGVINGYAQNLVKIAGNLIKIRQDHGQPHQQAPPMLQKLVTLKEQELNKLLLPLARLADAHLEGMLEDEFAQLCDGTLTSPTPALGPLTTPRALC